MRQRPLTTALIIALASIGLTGAVVGVQDYLMAPRSSMAQGYTIVRADLRGEQLSLAHANSPALRVRGLSGRTSLAPFHGMLFSFDEVGRHSIWMKDMRFSIDILWLDEERRIVEIAPQVAPETYPATFAPTTPARYVIELPGGTAQRLGLMVGEQVGLSF